MSQQSDKMRAFVTPYSPAPEPVVEEPKPKATRKKKKKE
tara:strand:+ start:1227 stop:1343 length:117 start_codon:yes stop_codon:yes gene_type:complete